jgi:hypothetical protein
MATLNPKIHLTYPNGSVETVEIVTIDGHRMFADAFYGAPSARQFAIQADILECIAEGATFGTMDDDGAEYDWRVDGAVALTDAETLAALTLFRVPGKL